MSEATKSMMRCHAQMALRRSQVASKIELKDFLNSFENSIKSRCNVKSTGENPLKIEFSNLDPR
jgi:hypothetical protein